MRCGARASRGRTSNRARTVHVFRVEAAHRVGVFLPNPVEDVGRVTSGSRAPRSPRVAARNVAARNAEKIDQRCGGGPVNQRSAREHDTESACSR